MRTGNRKAAATLVVLTPLVAELALGSTPIRMAWLVLLWLPIYGAGVLLIRECARRAGGGWASLILLGAAYEIVEDGIGLQALTSPHLYGAASWAPRVLGFNSAYWEANLGYHIVFSVLIPITLTNLLFPSHRDRPYLKRTGLIITGIVAVIGVGLVRISVPPSQDPGYTAPLPVLIGGVVAVAVLAVLALRVLPRYRAPAPDAAAPRTAPGPWTAGLSGAAATLAFMALTFPVLGARGPAFTHGAWAFLPMTAAAAVAVGTPLLIRHKTRATAWTDQATAGLITGALLAHTGFGLLLFGRDPVEQIGLELISGITFCLMIWLIIRLRRGRAAASLSRSSGSPRIP